jgi:acetoin utilization protein AcuC
MGGMRSAFMYSQQMARYKLSEQHPFDPIRIQRVYDLCRRYGLFDGNGMEVVAPAPVGFYELTEVHTYRYMDLLRQASQGEVSIKMLEYGIGTDDCPIFRGMIDFLCLCAGATAEAGARVVDQGYDFAFNPLGGFHHAGRERAEGFCYVNDVALIARRWAERGLKVMVIDIDAHHGNGTQDIFYEDPRVLTMSFHESGETLYPFGGRVDEIGAGRGAGYNLNVPMPAGSDDEVFWLAFEELFPPVIKAFAPAVVIGVVGADTMASDPLTNLKLTNNAYIQAVKLIDRLAPRWVALGAGGYDLDNVARAWTLLWAAVNRLDQDAAATAMLGGVFMGELDLGVGSLYDRAIRTSGPEKMNLILAIQDVIEYLKDIVFPILGAG